jgi:hypothetical protein
LLCCEFTLQAPGIDINPPRLNERFAGSTVIGVCRRHGGLQRRKVGLRFRLVPGEEVQDYL